MVTRLRDGRASVCSSVSLRRDECIFSSSLSERREDASLRTLLMRSGDPDRDEDVRVGPDSESLWLEDGGVDLCCLCAALSCGV